MDSISKLSASAVSAVSEITFAAANLNFDFSLVKVEAPQEFQALGRVLSHDRRKDAEEGIPHNTARKLAALFEPLLERTPELLKAYGTRSSEIAESPEINPRGSKKSHGLFFKQAGADCTTIWAAATSGQSAIALHLLACMLARIWNPDEATSIWVDIVLARKQEIQNDTSLSALNKLALETAAKQQITRDQLAQWDASARAWLQCADEAEKVKKKHTQFLLVLKNLSATVNKIQNTYKSVLQAWNSAMRMVENLLCGRPQETHDGAVLLGLSAWHLFPDLVVLGKTTTTIMQMDPLVPSSGRLTLGILESRSKEENLGISWSLPLASLNFYGDPVTATQAINPDTSRLTGQELAMLGLGSLLSRWDPQSLEAAHAAECLVAIWEYFNRHMETFTFKHQPTGLNSSFDSLSGQPRRFFHMMHAAARHYLEAKGVERERVIRLLQFGARRAKVFLSYNSDGFLGLLDSRNFIRALNNTETKISYLRQWATKLPTEGRDAVIQYRVNKSAAMSETRYRSSADGEHQDETNSEDSRVDTSGQGNQTVEDDSADTLEKPDLAAQQELYSHMEYASAWKVPSSSPKHDLSGAERPVTCHKRWIAVATPNAMPFIPSKCACKNTEASKCRCKYHCCASLKRFPAPQRHLTNERAVQLSSTAEWISTEEQLIVHSNPTQKLNRLIWHGSSQATHGTRGRTYDLVWGEPRDAALFLDVGTDFIVMPGWPDPSVFFASWTSALRTDSVYLDALQTIFWEHIAENQDYFTSLDALAIACEVYQDLKGATIDPRVTAQPIKDAKWYASYEAARMWQIARIYKAEQDRIRAINLIQPLSLLPHVRSHLTRSETFACISFFDSGHIDLEPKHLETVLAVSSGSSIYIALQLLEDPSKEDIGHQVRRIAGNVGQAGTSFLVPPRNPRVRAFDESSWSVINHHAFDGQVEDSFGGTSCHLSFTDYRMPIGVANQAHGRQDVEAHFVETVVSVYDSGKWVADLDILASLGDPDLRRERCGPGCTGKFKAATEVFGCHLPLTSVDNWDELLDRPGNAVVIRAHRNWLARLALASFAIGRGYRVYLLSDPLCWACYSENNLALKGDEVFIL